MDQTFLTPGDPAPSFVQRSPGNPRYAFDTAAGRWLVLLFLGSVADARSAAALDAAKARADLFNDDFASLFAVTIDPTDEAEGRIADRIPGVRHFLDFDLSVCRLYGVVSAQAERGPVALRRCWMVIDPTMRVRQVIPFAEDGADLPALFAALEALPPPRRFAGIELQAPILFLPDIFEPALCARLISLYEEKGGEESGFMREVDGKTVGVSDPGHKRRKDCLIEDEPLLGAIRQRFVRRVVPQIAKAHQFAVTRMERYIVACYAAEDGGHFRAHRDNTTKGTAHRRFAVSINLNAEFEGGEISFPEYGPRSFKPPPGAAVVFSCSLLHAVSRVTSGRRYAFLPFLYDDAAAALRERNLQFLAEAGAAQEAPERATEGS
ncbi:MAG: 2OG-Fe(II) oxygenase [Pikeienuella sp.]|uniref:2OG-Fe(II) oxygenase n=1 Tax=Pikeienuella sp. TaxID=2831957 RepID=UPI00391DFF83